jgi:two-component system phosphate regulon sensor histidine kinase PhoR
MRPTQFQFQIPWQTLSRVVLTQASFAFLLFLTCGIVTRIYFKTQIQLQLGPAIPAHLFPLVLKTFDVALIFLLSGISLILLIFATALATQLISPIKRILAKTRSVLNRENASLGCRIEPRDPEESLEAFGQESFGEWADLESSFEDIRKDLEKKNQRLKKGQEELATLMSAISDAILAVDTEECPLFYNSRFEILFGNHKLKSNPRLWEVFRDPGILSAFREALKQGKHSATQIIPFEDPSGKRYFSLSVSPLRQSQNLPYGAVGIFHDVTELKLAEQIRIDFVANVSHELRTPLTAIKGYADTLLMDIQQGQVPAPEFIEIITRNSDRLMHLIQDLLDLSSLESKELIHKSKINTEEVTSRILKQMQRTFESKDQSLEVKNQTPYVLADSKRLEQVLVNLLDNASKYTPKKGKISIQWEKAQNQGVVLTVQDTGPGIPLEHHSRLFERFYRVDQARSREQGGTGLGLAIVKHIMQKHDGSIQVESKSGEGSLFICKFPDGVSH